MDVAKRQWLSSFMLACMRIHIQDETSASQYIKCGVSKIRKSQ